MTKHNLLKRTYSALFPDQRFSQSFSQSFLHPFSQALEEGPNTNFESDGGQSLGQHRSLFIRGTIALLAVAVLLWGMGLLVDDAMAHSLAQDVQGRAYVVQPGDSLARIAHSELGAQNRWDEILSATNARAASDPQILRIENSRLIRPGQTLWIPDDTEPEIIETVTPEPPVNTPKTCATTSSEPPDRLYPSLGKDELWGYVNANGDPIIMPRFKIATDFSEGLAVASEDGELFGFIDETGTFKIEPIYVDAGHFSEGLAPVRFEDQWFEDEEDEEEGFRLSSFIDCSGRLDRGTFEYYLYAEPYQDGLAKVIDQEGNTLYIDHDATVIIRVQRIRTDDGDEDEEQGGPGDPIPPALRQWNYYYWRFR